MIRIGRRRFEELVSQALDSIPEELGAAMENVAVVVEPEPPDGEDLLGLYTGTPLTERGSDYSALLPDLIQIFAGPICRMCETEQQVVDEVLVTVVHEVAHHFGIDDNSLHKMGWG